MVVRRAKFDASLVFDENDPFSSTQVFPNDIHIEVGYAITTYRDDNKWLLPRMIIGRRDLEDGIRADGRTVAKGGYK